MNRTIYKVEGLKCHSCEILLKEKLLNFPGVKFVKSSREEGTVMVEHEGFLPDIGKINDSLKQEGFIFSETKQKNVYKVDGLKCHSCEIIIKEKISKIPGVLSTKVSSDKKEVVVEYDGEMPSVEALNDMFREEKFIFLTNQVEPIKYRQEAGLQEHSATLKHEAEPPRMHAREHVYRVEGMHCASCEILIEKKLLDISNVRAVDASTAKGEVLVQFEGDRPNPERLSRIFAEEKYEFSDKKENLRSSSKEIAVGKKSNDTLIGLNIAIFIIIAFLFLQKMGIADFLNISSSSSVAAFFGFGLLAGISSCAALVGGLVLSMSKQWQSLYSESDSTSKKLQPHLMFNAGRLVSYAVLGGVLGIIGSKLQFSLGFAAFLTISVSILMMTLGLQMLGVKAFRKFQFSLPKFATRGIANEKNFKGKYMPSIMGALTFFLPCGFTITAQGLALLSGNAFQGALIMGAFALGTVPSLLFIGLSSVKFSTKPHLAERFSKVAGFLVLFFALFNISSQMNVLGFTGIESLIGGQNQQVVVDEKDLPQIIDGKQVIKMNASASGYKPNYFMVRMGVPVKWEITDTGTSGCTNAIISKSLFDGSIDLTPGKVAVKEFTPQKAGKYKFSCWMGMVSGIIEVIDTAKSQPAAGAGAATVNAATIPADETDDVISSGASGCGCGGGSGSGSCH